MPVAQLNFGNQQATGDQALAGSPGLAFNVVVDGAGAVRRRPGIAAWASFPSSGYEASNVDAITSFNGNLVWVAGDYPLFFGERWRRVWTLLNSTTGALEELSENSEESLVHGPDRPHFAETQFRLIACAGGTLMTKYDVGASATDDFATVAANQVVALASRVITNDLTSASTSGRIKYSGVGSAGNETFGALGFVSAEARPDAVVALRENSNELYVFGETTLQVFSPDPQYVFVPGRTINRGCASADSVVRVDESFAWLDEQRQFVVSDGRSIDVVSDPIAAVLDSMETVSDCYGYRVNLDQFDCLVWSFPTDGRTFCYQRGGGWSQWSGWTDGVGHTRFAPLSHYYFSTDNVHLVGLSTGQVAELTTSATSDLGSHIKAEVTTGFMNHGTDAKKFTDCLRLTFKRGQTATGSAEPTVLLSWRDNLGAFGNPRRIGLGTTGDYVFTKELRSLGGYHRRQWRLEFTGAADFVLAGAEETFSVGSN